MSAGAQPPYPHLHTSEVRNALECVTESLNLIVDLTREHPPHGAPIEGCLHCDPAAVLDELAELARIGAG